MTIISLPLFLSVSTTMDIIRIRADTDTVRVFLHFPFSLEKREQKDTNYR